MPTTKLLLDAYRAAVDAASPAILLPRALDDFSEHTPALVLGAGKAAAAMAATFANCWRAETRGLVVTRYGHGLKPDESSGAIRVIEAGHPSPDSASVEAGKSLLSMAGSLRRDERLFFLISGGGSALAAVPQSGITFEQKRAAADFLLRAGADIREINCVRRHLSGLKGGRLAQAAHPAAVVTYAISDVPGDDIASIASGPTIPDPTSQTDALAVLGKFAYPAIDELHPVLEDPLCETPKPGDASFAEDQAHLIATAATALDAAETLLQREGFKVVKLGDDLDDEAQALGREHARLARRYQAGSEPVAILSGGETRVILGQGGGKGGRNLEYLSGFALEADGLPQVFALAADTDGIDGHGDHAGGIVTPDILGRGLSQGLSLERKLKEHDSYAFFDACDLLVKTGPTRTNVNDFRLILCMA